MINLKNYESLMQLECGFYEVSHKEYLAIPAVSNSAVSTRIKYPHGHVSIDGSTESMKMGTMFHEMILEPDVFSKKYHVMGIDDARKKEFKDELLSVPEDKTPIKPSTYTHLNTMKRVIDESKVASTLLDTPYKELTVIFDYHGLKCKAKIDALRFKDNKAVIVDLKTTSSLEPYMIKRHCRDFGYDRQAAFYLNSIRDLIDCEALFCNIFIDVPTDSKHTIGCLCAAFPESILMAAENQIDVILKEWHDPIDILDLEI